MSDAVIPLGSVGAGSPRLLGTLADCLGAELTKTEETNKGRETDKGYFQEEGPALGEEPAQRTHASFPGSILKPDGDPAHKPTESFDDTQRDDADLLAMFSGLVDEAQRESPPLVVTDSDGDQREQPAEPAQPLCFARPVRVVGDLSAYRVSTNQRDPKTLSHLRVALAT
jgi:hypothetical protein